MNKFWHFPAATGGMINSINNAGLETFRGNALDSLTREICQNSLDAVKDSTKPVVVEFNRFVADMNCFPEREQLHAVFLQSRETWRNRNKKSEDFIENALDIIDRRQLSMLRISDFNTKGLEGAKEGELGSPWSSLVREAGSSNKGESSGGSFGIGKSAPFLNSNLRTLFYSSLDTTGYKSYIGVANIMSFQKENGKTTLGNGYFTYNENSLAIPEQIFLDPSFRRTETGTDIYVTAFDPVHDWEKEVMKSVLYNFFITIFNQKLIVRINDFDINRENLEKLIYDLDDSEENQHLKSYFQLLTSDKVLKVPYPEKKYKSGMHFEEGEATLYLINGEDHNRRVLMTRKTGMRIFEQKGISGSISFTGLLMITGTNMNNIFKQMENPSHNEWSAERYEKDPKLADKVYKDLRKFIRDSVKQYFQEKVTDSMDAIGLSDFLPNNSLIDTTGVNKTESLNAKIKHIVTKEVKEDTKEKKKTKSKGIENTEDLEEQLAGEYGITPTGDEGGNGTGSQSGGGNDGGGATNPGGNKELDPETEGGTDSKRERKPSSKPIAISHKYVSTDKNNGKYRFIISSNKALPNGRLAFRVIGEQSDFNLPIKSATTDDRNITVDKCSSNNIHLHSIPAKKHFIVDVEIDYSDYCVMEVELYED
ncbi:hypothetical protein [Bacillus alkalisoli]|uniref:hypothetical protein n=1 Tax=Bacillus alkalisoli TaxID=2011008 RepID=UPI000C231105|nr:hypothetical protein [Bacillus alkalisoli]